MAKLEQGILGPFRGKVGTVVGYLWRGKHVVRAYRREINYPNTERQQAEREWFVSMVRFAATARQALLLGLREKASQMQMTEGNVFVKMNKSHFGRGAALCTPAEYERLCIAEGGAAPVRFTRACISENGVLAVDFESNSSMTRAKGADRVYVYAYNEDTCEGLLSAPTERRCGRLQMQLPDGWNQQNTKLWGFVVDSNGRASHSMYICLDGEDGTNASDSEPMNSEVQNIFPPTGAAGNKKKGIPLISGYPGAVG